MKKLLYKSAVVFTAALMALTSISCAKSPKALAQETVKLEQQALDAGTDAQKTAQATQDFAKHFEALDKLSETKRRQYEEALAALIADPAKTVVVNPLRGTRWTGVDGENEVLEFDRTTHTYKGVDYWGDPLEGKYELISGFFLEADGYTEVGKFSGNTLEFSDITFSKKSGTDAIKNTRWEGDMWGNPVSLDFTVDKFTMTAADESVEGQFGLFYVVNLTLPDGDTEEYRIEDNTLLSPYGWVAFNKSTGAASTPTRTPQAAAPASAAPAEPAQTSAPASSGTNWDSLLDQYEKFVDDYIAAMQKAAAGDFSAMTTAASLMEQAESLSTRLTAASGEISAAQSARLLRIQTKLANAAASAF